MSGDPWCKICQSNWPCYHTYNVYAPEEHESMIRKKTTLDDFTLKPLPDPFEAQSWVEVDPDVPAVVKAKDASKDDLISFLTAYLDDPVIGQRFADCVDMLRAKNADYTAGKGKVDRIYNFRRAAEEIGLPMEKVWYVYFWKHLTAVRKYIVDGKVESEPIHGRINDAINYLALLGAIIHSKENDE